MKALTLTQPWATLVAFGEKRVETRSWSTKYRGPVVIHAAKALPLTWRFMGGAQVGPFFRDALEEVCGLNEFGVPDLKKLPTGVALGICEIVDCVMMTPPFYDPEGYGVSNQERAFGDFGPGRWAWMLDNFTPLPEPLPVAGRQRLWNVATDFIFDAMNAPDDGAARHGVYWENV